MLLQSATSLILLQVKQVPKEQQQQQQQVNNNKPKIRHNKILMVTGWMIMITLSLLLNKWFKI